MQASGAVKRLNRGMKLKEVTLWLETITQNVQLPVTDHKFKGKNDHLRLTWPSKNSWKSWKLRGALKLGQDISYGEEDEIS